MQLTFILRKKEVKAARQLLTDTKLGKSKPVITKEKTWNKIGSMVTIFKIWRYKANKIGQGLDVSKHDQVIDNMQGSLIQEVLLSKCL